MSNVRIVSFDNLLKRLEDILGKESLLFQRFEFALNHKDENAIDAAMQSLNIYPEHTREAVQDAMLKWLFGQDEAILSANNNVLPTQMN